VLAAQTVTPRLRTRFRTESPQVIRIVDAVGGATGGTRPITAVMRRPLRRLPDVLPVGDVPDGTP
jgi:hypothetical protein